VAGVAGNRLPVEMREALIVLGLTDAKVLELDDSLVDLREEAERIHGQTYSFAVDADTSSAETRLAALRTQINRLGLGGDISLDRLAAAQARQVPGRAGGGPVWAGQPFLVGEQGPEIVTFGAAGHVIPAGQTAKAMAGASTINVTAPSTDAREIVEATERAMRRSEVMAGVR